MCPMSSQPCAGELKAVMGSSTRLLCFYRAAPACCSNVFRISPVQASWASGMAHPRVFLRENTRNRSGGQKASMEVCQSWGTGTPSLLTTQTLSLSPDSPATSMHTKFPLPSLLGH